MVPVGAGQTSGAGDKSALRGSSPPEVQPRCGVPPSRLRPELRRNISQLATQPLLHFPLSTWTRDPSEKGARGQTGGAKPRSQDGQEAGARLGPAAPRPLSGLRRPGRYCFRAAPARRAPPAAVRSRPLSPEGVTAEKAAAAAQ